MAERKYYCFCDSGCKYEVMTKEQTLAAITQAVNNGTIGDIDAGFVTTIKTIDGKSLRFFVGNQSEYDALSDREKNNLFAIISNDVTKEGLLNALGELQRGFSDLTKGLSNGDFAVKKANTAENATKAESDSSGNKFVEKYWNSSADAKINLFTNYVTLTEKGVYLVNVKIPASESADGNFNASTVIYFDGENTTVGMLNVVIKDNGTYAYRVKVNAGGKLTIQKSYKTTSAYIAYSDIIFDAAAAISISCRKIA